MTSDVDVTLSVVPFTSGEDMLVLRGTCSDFDIWIVGANPSVRVSGMAAASPFGASSPPQVSGTTGEEIYETRGLDGTVTPVRLEGVVPASGLSGTSVTDGTSGTSPVVVVVGDVVALIATAQVGVAMELVVSGGATMQTGSIGVA